MNALIKAMRKLFVALGYGSDVDEYTANDVVGTLKEFAVKAEVTGSVANVKGQTKVSVLNWIADNIGDEEKEPYDLTKTESHVTVTFKRNGKSQSASKDCLYNGDKLKVTATPAEGYDLTTLTANNEAIESGDVLTVDKHSIAIVASGTLKTFDLERSCDNVTTVVTVSGDAVTDGEGKLTYGDVATITATADDNYTLKSLKVNGEDFVSGSTLTVDADVEIVAVAEADAQG